MKIEIQKVRGILIEDIPSDIFDVWEWEIERSLDSFKDNLKKEIMEINIYYRTPQDCPYGRGNWIVDIHSYYGYLLCLKFPKDMSEEKILDLTRPLTDLINANKKSEINSIHS